MSSLLEVKYFLIRDIAWSAFFILKLNYSLADVIEISIKDDAQNFDIVITFQIYIINIEFNRTGIVTVEHTYFSLCVVDFKTILSEPPSDHFKGSLHVLNKKVKQSVQGTT